MDRQADLTMWGLYENTANASTTFGKGSVKSKWKIEIYESHSSSRTSTRK
jgi:hypothetical protein